MKIWSRRALLRVGSTAVTLPVLADARLLGAETPQAGGAAADAAPDGFPRHPPELVREVVTVAHFDVKRVQQLVSTRPALARAAWDWGFGDWETALGAASHMGNRAIAEYLVSQGARPSLFSSAMFGHLDVVKAMLTAYPGAQRIRGPHSISLLAHARAGGPGAQRVLDYLQSLDGAGDDLESPLTESERARILGTYIFGPQRGELVDVTLEHNRMRNTDQLTWTRKETMGRPLYHLGQLVFYPAGAPSVRIAFAGTEHAMVMTVRDPDLVLTATRT